MKLGGGESWLNPKFNINSFPIELLTEEEHEIINDGDVERSVEESEQ